MHPAAGLLGAKIPVGTIEGITGGTSGHGLLQSRAVEATV